MVFVSELRCSEYLNLTLAVYIYKCVACLSWTLHGDRCNGFPKHTQLHTE